MRLLTDKVVRRKWLEQYEKTLELLMVAMHLTGGLVSRGTELTSLQWANGWSSHRSVMLFDGDVTLVSTYNKIDANKSSPTVIARILPDNVRRLLVAWIKDVIPFYEAIQATMPLREHRVASPLLFHTEGIPWTTDRITKVLKRESEQQLGVPITTRDFRHVIIAIDKRLLRSQATTEIDIHILQSGHGQDVEDHHYALDESALQGLSEESLTAFRAVSSCWHRFWSGNQQIAPRLVRSDKLGGDTRDAALMAINYELGSLRKLCETLLPGGKNPNLPVGNKQLSLCSEGDVVNAMERMVGSRSFRSPEQKEAILHVGNSIKDCLFRAPTGIGKTMAYLVPAYLERGFITAVFVPYTALRDEILGTCRRMGIAASELTSTSFPQTSVVVGVPELSTGDAFVSWVKKMADSGTLRRVVFDECHHLVMDVEWRNSWNALAILFRGAEMSSVQKVFLTATLPLQMKTEMYQLMGVRNGDIVEVTARTVQANIRHEVVTVVSEEVYSEEVKRLVQSKEFVGGTLVYVLGRKLGKKLALELGCDFFSGDSTEGNKKKMVDNFKCGSTTMIVATTALAEGVNTGAGLVLIVGGSWSIVDYSQQGGRAGRDGTWSTVTVIMAPSDWDDESASEERKVVLAYLRTLECRKRFLSAYLDGYLYLGCADGDNKCDRCWVDMSSKAMVRSSTSFDLGVEVVGHEDQSVLSGSALSLILPDHNTVLDMGWLATEMPRDLAWAFANSGVSGRDFCGEMGPEMVHIEKMWKERIFLLTGSVGLYKEKSVGD